MQPQAALDQRQYPRRNASLLVRYRPKHPAAIYDITHAQHQPGWHDADDGYGLCTRGPVGDSGKAALPGFAPGSPGNSRSRGIQRDCAEPPLRHPHPVCRPGRTVLPTHRRLLRRRGHSGCGPRLTYVVELADRSIPLRLPPSVSLTALRRPMTGQHNRPDSAKSRSLTSPRQAAAVQPIAAVVRCQSSGLPFIGIGSFSVERYCICDPSIRYLSSSTR